MSISFINSKGIVPIKFISWVSPYLYMDYNLVFLLYAVFVPSFRWLWLRVITINVQKKRKIPLGVITHHRTPDICLGKLIFPKLS